MITALQELEEKWTQIQERLTEQFGNQPDLNMVLILIGIRELGIVKSRWTKEDKVNLMHIAVCRLLSPEGYYELEGHDKDGWPHWKMMKKLPFINVVEQEMYLKERIVDYFEEL